MTCVSAQKKGTGEEEEEEETEEWKLKRMREKSVARMDRTWCHIAKKKKN